MELDDLRERVAFHNTVDVWIAACRERGAEWRDADGYRSFVGRLRGGGVQLRPYGMCVSDAESADEGERAKAAFAAELAAGGPGGEAYGVRLTDRAVAEIRRHAPGGPA